MVVNVMSHTYSQTHCLENELMLFILSLKYRITDSFTCLGIVGCGICWHYFRRYVITAIN